jgi:hypothetical protein
VYHKGKVVDVSFMIVFYDTKTKMKMVGGGHAGARICTWRQNCDVFMSKDTFLLIMVLIQDHTPQLLGSWLYGKVKGPVVGCKSIRSVISTACLLANVLWLDVRRLAWM